MKKLWKLTLACFLTCSSIVIGHAQSSTALKPGVPVEREISSSETHTFTIDLEENSLVQLVVEQKSIDVTIRVSTPESKTLGDYDTPNGAQGPEHVSFVALTSGAYSIAVSPLYPETPAKGRYEIKIVDIRKATEQELNTRKDLEVVKAKAVALLKDLEGTISEVKSPETRIRARLQASDLLVEDDADRGNKYFTDAIADLKETIAALDVEDENYPQRYSTIWQVRYEVVQILLESDPSEALNFIYSTVPRPGTYSAREQELQESNLEMSVANKIASKDPQRTLQLARKSLKQGYSMELIRTVYELRAHDPKLASQFLNEIIDKLRGETIIKNSEAAQLATSLVSTATLTVDSSASVEGNGNGSAAANGAGVNSYLLPDDKRKELLNKLIEEVMTLSTSNPAAFAHTPGTFTVLNILRTMGPALDEVAGGSSAAVAKKFSDLTGGAANFVQTPQEFTGTVEESLESIQKAPAETREQLYLNLVSREISSGESERARQVIDDHIKNPYQRREWLKQIEYQKVTQAINGGKFEEALRIIGSRRTPGERANYLIQLVSNLGKGQKRATALNLLEQARALLPVSPQAQDAEQMRALLEIARAFSYHDSKRAFEVLDPLVDQFNELCAAARILNGFGGEYFIDDEPTEEGNSVQEVAYVMSSVLGSLALTNFERAKGASERIREPHVRLKALLDIARVAIEGEQ